MKTCPCDWEIEGYTKRIGSSCNWDGNGDPDRLETKVTIRFQMPTCSFRRNFILEEAEIFLARLQETVDGLRKRVQEVANAAIPDTPSD